MFLWLNAKPGRLGQHLKLLEDPRTEMLVSAVVSWEIAIKHGLGRLPLPEPPERYVPDRIRAIGATAVAIEHSHALAVASLPHLHRDPFDRLLIAQGAALDATILTADPVLARYPAEVLVAP